MEMDEEDMALVRAKLEAANMPGVEPDIASSRVDNGATDQTASTDDGNGG